MYLSFQAVSSQIDLPDDFVYYFGLYLVKKQDKGDNASKNRHDVPYMKALSLSELHALN